MLNAQTFSSPFELALYETKRYFYKVLVHFHVQKSLQISSLRLNLLHEFQI